MNVLTRREAILGICGTAGAALLAGCAVNPVTGRRELMLMTENQEISLGQSAHEDIIRTYGVYRDATLEAWFTRRGDEMAKVTHRPGLPYHFAILDSPVVNAFALPGGYVYVTRGILGYFNDEAQFAGVLGHELGHVNARHSAQQYSKAQLANLTIGIGSIFSEEFARYAQFASVGMTLLFLRFSRDNEREADRLGVEYSSKVGFDAVEMSVFFETLERMRPAGGSLPEWQSTHPDPGDRITTTHNQALAFQRDNPGEYVKRRNEYLELINGITFGEDPRQGYVREGMFYHPELTLQFPVPDGWEVTNTPSEVRLTPQDQNAMIIFTLASGSDPAASAKDFIEGNQVEVAISGPVVINGMNGTLVTGTLTVNDQVLAVTSHFIRKGERVFAFHGLTTTGNAAAYAPVFSAVPGGFDRLDDPDRINVAPKRVEVRAVDQDRTLSQTFNAMGVPEDQCEALAVVNGLELSDTVSAGTRIKIIV